MFCTSRVWFAIFGFLNEFAHYKVIFARFMDMWKKADLNRAHQNPKRKLVVATHFSEIIELKFKKKSHTFLVF